MHGQYWRKKKQKEKHNKNMFCRLKKTDSSTMRSAYNFFILFPYTISLNLHASQPKTE